MSFVNPDNLIAVALVINRSRDGPAFVFHYPPVVLPVSADADYPGDAADSEDMLLERLSRPLFRDADDHGSLSKHGGTRGGGGNNRHSYDEHTMSDSGTQTVPWESVAGFPTRDLASILTPARPYHKKLFQLSLDPLLCVSYPIHVPESGKWKRAKKNKPGRPSSVADDEIPATSRAPSIAVSAPSAPTDSDGAVDKEKDKDKKEEDEEKRSSMTMFNLVFILQPKKDQTRELVDALYANIAKKVNKAFKYSQQHSDFVWKESKKILATKDRAREDRKRMSQLWKELLQQYSLAASVHDIFEAVSQNRIATLHLDTAAGVLSPSVQIPAPFYVADLPLPDEARRARGLWLTTANAFLTQDALEEPGFLDRNFGLLLMEDEKKIVAELQADGDPSALPMVEFVRLSKPTMSFYQVGQSNILSLSQVRKFAQHFIFWRRAIAIPPLHARDTYVVSPNCDLSRLPEASASWQRAFPLAPPLANLLSDMSVCPRPYKTFCPSKVHRPLYLRMLAWLVRGGWVTQLCTFAYVVVWPEIVYQVDYEMEAEELEGPTPSTSPHSAGAVSSVSPMSTAVPTRPHNQLSRLDDADQDGDEVGAAVLSPASTSSALSASLAHAGEPGKGRQASIASTASASASDVTASGSLPSTAGAVPIPSTTERAAEAARLARIAQRVSREAADKAAAHARKVVPEVTAHPSTNRSAHLAGIAPHIILDAKKTTGPESRYLAAIASRLRDDRIRQAWATMCRYFDGHSALERIALQEEMKRKEAWTLLTAMSEYLICTRHW
ncbi:hypothetical protein V2A60_001113 [Cordyceps javanica]